MTSAPVTSQPFPIRGQQACHQAASGRRNGWDRRASPTPMLCRYTFFGGRRASVRREEEREGSYVDRIGGGMTAVALAVLLFNVVDAGFTLFFIKEGAAVELNPFADYLMALGDQVFIWAKSLGIGFVILFLALSRHFKAARVGLWTVFTLYGLLALYHLTLLAIYLAWYH